MDIFTFGFPITEEVLMVHPVKGQNSSSGLRAFDRPFHLGPSVGRNDPDLRVLKGIYPKNPVGERPPDLVDPGEVQDHYFEPFESGQKTFVLGPENTPPERST